MTISEEMNELVDSIPFESDEDKEKYNDVVAHLLTIQAAFGKIDQSKQMLAGEVNKLGNQKEALATGYANQLAYRKSLEDSSQQEFIRQETKKSQAELEAEALRKFASTAKPLF